MKIKLTVDVEERVDNLTLASSIVALCKEVDLNAVKVANAILVEMVGEE